MSNDSKKVYVGLSGGVDSSVSAALLKKQGFDVTGVFIKIWHPELSNCDWKAEMRDAMRVCAHLDIPFKMIDLSDKYFKEVINYLIDDYKNGRTPNPDVMCNKIIKFGHFYDWAINEEKANFVATGHYAFIDNGKMIKGVDQNKDQTYFLWNIQKEALNKVIFPVGKYQKREVRNLAEKFKLPTASKRDSQGLCFIGDVDVKAFLKKHLNTKEGNVLDKDGNIIGTHEGSELYTFGERHGFKINNKIDNQSAHYVIEKDLEKNTITVSENFDEENINIKEVVLKDVNFLVDDIEFDKKDSIDFMTRYQGKLRKGKLIGNKINFENPERPVASGQSIVFYDGNICLGGGIVDFCQ